MPVTSIDPVTALVVIDLQRGIVQLPTVHPSADVVANAARLARAFRERGLPVVLVAVEAVPPGRTETPGGGDRPDDWTVLVDELEAAEDDIRVVKRSWGAFATTDLEDRLRERGVTQVVLCGISTSAGVESTAREAFSAGLHVTLATDAMTDREAVVHDNSVHRIFPRLGETGTTDDVLAALPR